MYKLVIVEDERDVRQRLANLIGKSGSNFEIVSEYETGIDAYEGIISDNPDLILTDIKIPYIDGIELSKKVRAVYPHVRIIIITGYNEFDYAKEAANLGVVGFISKPVTFENIRDLLNKAEASLSEEFLSAENLSGLSAFYESSLPIIRENDLYRLSGMSDVTPAFEAKLKSNGISLDYTYFVMCVFDFDETPEGDAERYDLVFSLIRKSVTEDLVVAYDHDLFNSHEKLCLLLKSKAQPDIKALEQRIERIVHRVSRFSDIPVSAGLSSVYKDSKNFAAMVKEAIRALEYRSLMGGQKIFFFGNAEPSATALSADDKKVKEIGYILHSRPLTECIEGIDSIRSSLANSGDGVYYLATGILNVLIGACDDLEGLYARCGGPDNLHRKLFGLKTDDEIFDYLKEMVHMVRELNDGVLVNNVDQNLRKVVSYMEAHFCDPDINFESLAKEVNFSVSYISALLRKKQGISFVKMLTSMRMEKAKELLLNPSLKIIDIAERLGYNDSYYFSHCFKKHVGISPKEFRNNEQGI